MANNSFSRDPDHAGKTNCYDMDAIISCLKFETLSNDVGRYLLSFTSAIANPSYSHGIKFNYIYIFSLHISSV